MKKSNSMRVLKDNTTRQSIFRTSLSSISLIPSGTSDEILKRIVLTYLPIFTLVCLFSSTFIIPMSDFPKSDERIIKYIVVDKANNDRSTVDEITHQDVRNSIALNQNDVGELRVDGGLPLDFLVGGFPKSGSTSLLHLFGQHNETSVAPIEVCAFNNDISIAKLSTTLNELPLRTSSMLRGIKCPTTIWDSEGLAKLSTLHSDLKIIIGVRHPVLWFQSYYNYRITEMHDKNLVMHPPPAESLIGSKSWKGISTNVARFELGLMQLGKIEVHHRDLVTLGKAGRRIFPSKFKIFLYSIEQLEDSNEQRSQNFNRDLQNFLGLQNEIKSIPKSNVNHFVGTSKHPETIDICDDKYRTLRDTLVKNGSQSNRWLRSKFVNHADVTVGGRSHFLRIIDSWETDPCHKTQSKEMLPREGGTSATLPKVEPRTENVEHNQRR